MKVFEFSYGGKYRCAINAENKELATDHFKLIVSDEIDEVNEIPQEKWDEKIIKYHEDNDSEKPEFHLSIRDVITSDIGIVYTNDNSLFD